MEQHYLASDALLLLASDGSARGKLIEQIDASLGTASLLTSSYSLLEAARIFAEKNAIDQFKPYLWRVRPLFDAVLDFTGEDMDRALALIEAHKVPMRQAVEAALVLNHGIAAILSSSEKFDWIAGLRRIPVTL